MVENLYAPEAQEAPKSEFVAKLEKLWEQAQTAMEKIIEITGADV